MGIVPGECWHGDCGNTVTSVGALYCGMHSARDAVDPLRHPPAAPAGSSVREAQQRRAREAEEARVVAGMSPLYTRAPFTRTTNESLDAVMRALGFIYDECWVAKFDESDVHLQWGELKAIIVGTPIGERPARIAPCGKLIVTPKADDHMDMAVRQNIDEAYRVGVNRLFTPILSKVTCPGCRVKGDALLEHTVYLARIR